MNKDLLNKPDTKLLLNFYIPIVLLPIAYSLEWSDLLSHNPNNWFIGIFSFPRLILCLFIITILIKRTNISFGKKINTAFLFLLTLYQMPLINSCTESILPILSQSKSFISHENLKFHFLLLIFIHIYCLINILFSKLKEKKYFCASVVIFSSIFSYFEIFLSIYNPKVFPLL